MESTSRSRRNPKLQNNVVMKSWRDHQWKLILKMLKSRILQRKLARVISKRSKNQININPLKAKEIEIIKNQIMMNLQ